MTSENTILEYLSAMRADLSHMAGRMDSIAVEMRATRQHVAGLAALQDHHHVEIAQIKLRLDRLERRLAQAN